jgi:hypothetical protein
LQRKRNQNQDPGYPDENILSGLKARKLLQAFCNPVVHKADGSLARSKRRVSYALLMGVFLKIIWLNSIHLQG